MENLSSFCTCTDLDCPFHPTRHDKGCAPCIAKNLRLREVPNCFFNLVEGSENCKAYHFEDFAECIMRAAQTRAKEEQ